MNSCSENNAYGGETCAGCFLDTRLNKPWHWHDLDEKHQTWRQSPFESQCGAQVGKRVSAQPDRHHMKRCSVFWTNCCFCGVGLQCVVAASHDTRHLSRFGLQISRDSSNCCFSHIIVGNGMTFQVWGYRCVSVRLVWSSVRRPYMRSLSQFTSSCGPNQVRTRGADSPVVQTLPSVGFWGSSPLNPQNLMFSGSTVFALCVQRVNITVFI